MPQLMNMQGVSCGHIDEGQPVPDGYWARPDNAPEAVSRLEFFERVGQERFTAIFVAMQANPALAFQVFRGFAAETINLGQSFPAVLQMEALGILPSGSAIEIWS